MTYNGHKNWDYWNVALWIGNDEGLYNLAKECKREGARSRFSERRPAEELFIEQLHAIEITHTPDGAKYTKSNIRAALREL